MQKNCHWVRISPPQFLGTILLSSEVIPILRKTTLVRRFFTDESLTKCKLRLSAIRTSRVLPLNRESAAHFFFTNFRSFIILTILQNNYWNHAERHCLQHKGHFHD